MAEQRLMLAIGRIERALSRLERTPASVSPANGDAAMAVQHERLKAAAQATLEDLDRLLARADARNG